jgi:hypothetical protein
MARQSTTFFDFKGGLNTEASPINIPASDASDLININLNQDGSIEPRKGIDFLGEKIAGGFYETSSFDFSSHYGSYSTPVPSFKEVSFVTSTGNLLSYVISIIGKTISVYNYSSPDDLVEISSPIQEIVLTDNEANDLAAYHKTIFLLDQNRVLVINPYIRTGYLEISNDDVTLNFLAFDVFTRGLGDDGNIDSRVNYQGKSYLCIKSHNQSPAANISVGTDWQDYWVNNGSAISGDPTWSSVSAVGAGTWKPRMSVGFEDVSYYRPDLITTQIIENGYYWRVKDLGAATYNRNDGTYTEISGRGIFLYSSHRTGSIEPNWGTPVIGSTAKEKIYYEGDMFLGDARSGYEYIVWEAYASTADPTNTVFNSNVTELISKEYSSANDEQDIKKFTAATTSKGRLWLAGLEKTPNTVYYSQTVDAPRKYGRFYQHADPYSDTDTEVVDSDGGTIIIGNAERILALQDFDNGTAVLASNGIWFIYGQDTFRPNNFIVDKISDDGLIGSDAFTMVDDKLVYFGKSKIWEILPRKVTDNKPSVAPISTKINTFYNSLSEDNRAAGKAVYNQATNKLFYALTIAPSDIQSTRNRNNQSTDTRDALIYDDILKAWTMASIVADSTGSKVTLGDIGILSKGRALSDTVVDNLDNVVVDESDETVVAQDITSMSQITTVFLYIKKNGDNCDFSFGQFSGDSYEDFSLNSVDTESFPAYIDMAHNLYNDVIHKKQFPYVMTIFERLESGVLDDSGEDVTQGSCKMRVDWNWSTNTSSSKFGELRQVYFPYKFTTSHFDGVDPGLELVTSKHKIRGRGNTMRLHFEKDDNKGFKLLGWQLLVKAKRNA